MHQLEMFWKLLLISRANGKCCRMWIVCVDSAPNALLTVALLMQIERSLVVSRKGLSCEIMEARFLER